MKKLGYYLNSLWRLSRIPFLSVGILPLILGFTLAWRMGYRGPAGLYILCIITVTLIMWMTYYLGEVNDLEGDRINKDFNQFSGGSRVLIEERLPRWVPIALGYGCMIGAILIGSYIYFYYHTGPYTPLLGGIGIFSGYFYSEKPFRWAYRGIGEVLIGFCYGWLPIATGSYLFTGFFGNEVLLLSLPVGLSIFNVILINEFPDEEADRRVGKKTLVVRFGKERMADLYLGLFILIGLSFIKVLLSFGKPPGWLMLISIFPLIIILLNIIKIFPQGSLQGKSLNGLCRNTLLVNISITMILTVQQSL